MKFIKLILFISIIAILQACSWDTVPPTAKGKILTTSGYNDEILEPGKYTLGTFFRW